MQLHLFSVLLNLAPFAKFPAAGTNRRAADNCQVGAFQGSRSVYGDDRVIASKTFK